MDSQTMPIQPSLVAPREEPKVVGVPQWLMAIAVGAFVTSSVAAVGGVVQQQKAQAASEARADEREKADAKREEAREKAMGELKTALKDLSARMDAQIGDRWTATQDAARAAQDRAERIALEARLMDAIRNVEARTQASMSEIQRQLRGK